MDATQQLDPDELRRNLAITLGTQQPQLANLREPQMAAPPPVQQMPNRYDLALPSTPQPKVIAPRGTTQGDLAERSRLMSSGSGISQISPRIQNSNFGQNHPVLGKVLGGLAQGAATVGDIGLSALGGGFGRLAAMQIPGTEEHHNMLLHKANTAVAQDEENAGREAQTAHLGAETENLKNPPDKFAPLPTEQGYQAFDPKTGETKPLTSGSGQPLQPFRPEHVKTIDEQAYESLIGSGKSPLEALDAINGSKNTKAEDLPHMYLEALQSGDTAKAALIKRAHEETQVKPAAAPGVTMIVPQADGTQKVERLTAGQTVAPGAQTAQGVNAVNTPTMTQRTAAGRAQTVVEMAPDVIGEINSVAGDIGPISGRWNDFMQGKIGMDNPKFAALRTDLVMLSSAVALAHAQGRLPENLRQEFDHMINAPNQTPENLKAVISHILPWMQKMREGGQGPKAPGATAQPTHKYNPATGGIEAIQ